MKSAGQTAPNSTAILLLFINGSLIALMLTLATLATGQGVSPIAYAFWQTLGGGLLLGLLAVRQQAGTLNRAALRYFMISGATVVAIPNATAFFVVGKIGAGFTATLYAFPPIFTLLMSLAIKLETMSTQRLLGICFACAGCFLMIWAQQDSVSSDAFWWYVVGLVIPFSLAFGNVYRSIAWPKSFAALPLASGMLFSAAALLGTLSLLGDHSLTAGVMRANNLGLMLAQVVITALTYLGFFELQKRSTPVFLSQMGAVAALVGLAIGLFYFGTQYSLGVWLGVLVVISGLIITIKSQ